MSAIFKKAKLIICNNVAVCDGQAKNEAFVASDLTSRSLGGLNGE
jgi:hypothetical protein